MKRILALVLSLVMALSLCAPAWGAVTDEASFVDAIEAASDGGTITLDNTISIAGDVTIDKNVTIDTTGIGDAITVTGKLTLGENVTFTSNTTGLVVSAGGELIVNGATVYGTGGSGWTIIDVNGADAVLTVNAGSTIYRENGSTIGVHNGTLNINGGTVYNTGNVGTTLFAYADGVINVFDGEVYSEANSAVSVKGGKLYVNGGTVSSDAATPSFCAAFSWNGGEIYVEGGSVLNTNPANPSCALIAAKTTGTTGGKVYVNDGTVGSVLAHEAADAVATITGGTIIGNVAAKNDATVEITGGTFDVEPNAEYIKDGYEFKGGQVSEIVPEPVYYTLTVKHVDEDGTAVADEVTDSVEANTTYSTTAKVIDGYEAGVLSEDSDAASGTMDSDKTVIYVYAKEPVSDNPTPDDPSTGTDVPKDPDDPSTGTDIPKDPDDPTDPPAGGDDPTDPNPDEPTPDEPTPDEPTPEEPTPDEPADEPESVTVPSNEAADLVKKPNTKIDFKNGYSQSDLDNADDEDISTKFVITVDSSATVPSDVENKLKNADEVICLDIDLHLYIDGKHAGDITELHRPVEIRIPVSLFNFDSVAKGHTRHYYVVRLHDGEVEVLKAKLVGDELVIRSDRFSPYYVAYEDVKASPSFGWGTTTTTNPDVNSPKTFDAGIALYVGMSVAAAVGTVVVSKKRKD